MTEGDTRLEETQAKPEGEPDAATLRASLLAQHQRLRELLSTAVALARREVGPQLSRLLESIRQELAAHNVAEEAALEPLLRWDFAWGPARIARMLEEHAAEHAVLRALFAGSDAEVAARLPDFAEELEAHMQAEERTILNPRVLRQEIVIVETGD